MKTVLLIAAALVLFSSVPLKAQQAGAQQSTSVQAPGSQVSESGRADAGVNGKDISAQGSGSAAVEEMKPVNAELVGKLDSKTAKTGDRVVVKTQEALKTADGREIPKGTRLVGHVTEVRAHDKSNEDAQMAIQFDRAELKDGQSVAIQSEIRSIAPPASAAMAESMQGDDGFGAGPAGGPVRGVGAGNVRGGGVLGGAVGGAANATAHTTAGVGSLADDNLRGSGRVAATATGGLGNVSERGAGGLAAHATAVHGVMLAGDASGKTSGMLSASRQNVHLDGGTQMVLGIAAAK